MKLATVEILRRLVAFPTISCDPNLPLIDWVRNYLADLGIESHQIPDATGRKANLFASIGPAEEGGVVFSGHTDVVPIEGQRWNTDPFTLTEDGQKLYGRGTSDMKGFIAAALSLAPLWREAKLSRPVHLMLSYDEEIGCRGAPLMISAAQRVLPAPAAVIVGEPTGMRVANQHKGYRALRTRISGIEAHSSLTHQGVSAVMLAAQLIARLTGLERELSTDVARHERRFSPPYTTISVNRIAGGTATNILAGECEFEWDIRTLPGELPDDILQELSAFANAQLGQLLREGRKCAIQTATLADVPPLRPDSGRAETLARTVLGGTSDAITTPFGTEAGQFQGAGWSTVVCGPGSIEQAHKPNEYIERGQLADCEAFMARLVARQCQ